MQFQVIGKDGTDDEALNRRLAARDEQVAAKVNLKVRPRD